MNWANSGGDYGLQKKAEYLSTLMRLCLFVELGERVFEGVTLINKWS
jgi:hypothetical protein